MKTIKLMLFLFLVIVSLCGKARSKDHGKQTSSKLSVADQVRESVFRYQFWKFAKLEDKHFFVGNGYKAKDDPSPELIQRLQSNSYSVKGISQCISSPRGVIDTKTKVKGLEFVVTKIELVSSKKVEVHADFFRDGKAGNDALYTLENINGNWHVVKCKILDVS